MERVLLDENGAELVDFFFGLLLHLVVVQMQLGGSVCILFAELEVLSYNTSSMDVCG